jgi:hypothetical protein
VRRAVISATGHSGPTRAVPATVLARLAHDGFEAMVDRHMSNVRKRFKVPVFAHEKLDIHKVS